MAESFGERLQRLREGARMNRKALAYAVGCTDAFIRQMESGRKSPSLRTLGRLAAALGVSQADLLSREVGP